MNPFLYVWMYESWIQDLREKTEFARNNAILTGSFSNMELAKKMIKKPNFQSSDEDFEATYQMIEEDVNREESHMRRRRRKRRRYGVVDG